MTSFNETKMEASVWFYSETVSGLHVPPGVRLYFWCALDGFGEHVVFVSVGWCWAVSLQTLYRLYMSCDRFQWIFLISH